MNEILYMDEIDKKIVKILQNRPNISHTDIAKKVNRSQPTVGLRIKRLMEAELLDFQAGINIKKSKNILVRVDMQTNKPDTIFQIAKKSPYVLNAYKVSGLKNVELLLKGKNLKTLDEFINLHFRKKTLVKKLSIKVITNILNKFVIPLNIKKRDS